MLSAFSNLCSILGYEESEKYGLALYSRTHITNTMWYQVYESTEVSGLRELSNEHPWGISGGRRQCDNTLLAVSFSILLCLESLGFLPGTCLQSILVRHHATRKILKKQSKKRSKLNKNKQRFGWICVQNAKKKTGQKKNKSFVPNSLVFVTMLLEPTRQCSNIPLFRYHETLASVTSNPLWRQTPTACLLLLPDGNKGLTTICIFATLETKTTYLVTTSCSLTMLPLQSFVYVMFTL